MIQELGLICRGSLEKLSRGGEVDCSKGWKASLILLPPPHTVLITCTVACCTTPGTALRGLGTRVGQPPVSLCFIQKLCRGPEGLPSGNSRSSETTVSSTYE